MTRLGDVLADVKPGFASGDDLVDGVFQFRMHNFRRDGSLDLAKRRRVNATARQMELQSVRPGDVLFNATNSPELVGKSALIGMLDEPAVFSNHFLRLRTRSDQLNPGYLAHYLRRQFSLGVFIAMAKAWVNQATIGRDRIEDLRIPLPTLSEQRRIATILDHADALRAKRRQVLAHLDSLKQSIFQDMFGDELAERHRLDQIADVASGITKGRKTNEETESVPYLAVSNVQAGFLSLDSVKEIPATASERARYALRDGDLVLTEGGDPDKLGRGTVWRAQIPLCLHQNHIFRVRPDTQQVLPDYLSACLASTKARTYFLQSAKQTTGIASINMTQLRAAPVAVPPMEAQQCFIQRSAAVIAATSAASRALAADNGLFALLQARAFSGRL